MIPTGLFDTLFAKLAVWTTLLAAMTAMISNPHVALNREQKGGIVVLVFEGSETKQRTVSRYKVAKVKRG
jgi:hypothetical protein